MGCPAGVPDTRRSADRLPPHQVGEVGQPSRCAAPFDPAAHQGSDAGRVIAPVLQAAQTFEDNVQGIVSSICPASGVAHISNDSTHAHKPSRFPEEEPKDALL
jgi:hypothetical protein